MNMCANRRRFALAAALTGLACLCVSSLLSAEARTKIEANTRAEAKTKTVIVHGTEIRGTEHKEGDSIVLTFTDAVATQDDATFTSDLMVVKTDAEGKKVEEVTCTGNPVFNDPENHITGDKVIAHNSPRQAEFIGNVKMVSTPAKKSDAKQGLHDKISSEPSTTTCHRLLYNYASKKAEAHGNVVIVQKARTVWADDGVYDQKLELATLTGNVHMKNTGDEELKNMKDAETVTVSLENSWIDILAKKGSRVGMEFQVKDEDDSTAAAATAKTEDTKETRG